MIYCCWAHIFIVHKNGGALYELPKRRDAVIESSFKLERNPEKEVRLLAVFYSHRGVYGHFPFLQSLSLSLTPNSETLEIPLERITQAHTHTSFTHHREFVTSCNPIETS